VLNLLDDDVVRVRTRGGGTVKASLPSICAVADDDRIESFPALRAHQQHPWHALVAQAGPRPPA